MPGTLDGVELASLERLCGRRAGSIRFGPSARGVERAEVFLSGCAFQPHRHDTYAIGITTAGVQTFRYRGARRVCLRGQLHILHPDEEHDGAPATDGGFGYRIVYLAPELVRDALAGGPLPFVADTVQDLTPAARPLAALLTHIDESISELGAAEIAATVADALRSLAGPTGRDRTSIDLRAVTLVREHLAACAREQTSAAELERLAGIDRFTLARHFRRAFGTSPDRYRTLRRLALARAAIQRGQPLAQVAADTGFADQSHLTRQFKRAYGLTPAHWGALTAGRPVSTPEDR
jgi:AraC-like DNA-binding protein